MLTLSERDHSRLDRYASRKNKEKEMFLRFVYL